MTILLSICLGTVPTALPSLDARAPAGPPNAELVTEYMRALADFETAESLRDTRPARARQFFRLAAQRLESLVALGIHNGRLEFNLANCYIHAGDIGRAVLHYRRAERLIPRDPLLANNLAVARSRCLTSIRPSRQRALWNMVFAWHHRTSAAERTAAALASYAALWGLLIARIFAPRRPITVLAAGFGILACITAGSLAMTWWTDRNVPEGVVTASEAAVHGGPGARYPRMFEQSLQPGVEFRRLERRGRWCRIELRDGQSGWIEAAKTDLVLAPEL